MSFSVPQNPALEGIISFLASRPHGWDEWRIDSLRTFDAQSKMQHQELVLEIKQGSRKIRVHFNGLNPSPSQIVQEALTTEAKIPQKSPDWLQEGLKKPWKKFLAAELTNLEKIAEVAVLEKRQFSAPESTSLFVIFQ